MDHNKQDYLRKGQHVEVYKSAIAGAVSGLVARLLTAPMDTLKIRYQIQPMHESKYGGMLSTVRTIAAEEGARGLWKGNVPASIMYVLYGAVQFSSFSTLNELLSGNNFPPVVHTLIVGALAGMTSSVATYPFDVLRTRFVANRGVKMFKLGVSTLEIWRHEGFQGFFRGVTSSAVSVTLSTSIIFATYESIKIFCEKHNDHGIGVETLEKSASMISGVAAKIVTFPIDTVRRRILVKDSIHLGKFTKSRATYERYRGSTFIRMGLSMYRHEGLLSLYKGLTMALLKTAPTTAISIGIYEWSLKMIA